MPSPSSGSIGNGPIHRKLGRRVAYCPVDLEQWFFTAAPHATLWYADARFPQKLDARTPTLKWDNGTPTPSWQKSTAAIRWRMCRAVLQIHKNTVPNWLRQGLTAIDLSTTALFGARTSPLPDRPPGECKEVARFRHIYCLPCRAPKVPAGNMAECITLGETIRTLRGIRPDFDPDDFTAVSIQRSRQRGVRRPRHHARHKPGRLIRRSF